MMKFRTIAAGCLLLTVFACNKPETVLYKDSTTALYADKSTWTATASSEELSGEGAVNGRAITLLDGNINTFWHSTWSAASNPVYPHWVMLDMKEEKAVVAVVITNRQGASPRTNGIKKFLLEGSKNGTSFTKLGEYNFAISNAGQNFPVSAKERHRYLRVTALESHVAATTSTSLADIDVIVPR